MKTIAERLDLIEETIKNQTFIESANNWVFSYDPKDELIVRERIQYLKQKNNKAIDGFELAVFDLYDIIIDFLEKEDFVDQCYKFEKKHGMKRITKALNSSMRMGEDNNYLVQYICEHTSEKSVVFLVGIGKCYPLFRSHNTLNTIQQSGLNAPVVLFFPGKYDEQELILFNEIKDANHYRAKILVE